MLFDHHLQRHLHTKEEQEVGRSVERMFRHSLAKHGGMKKSFFSDELTADKVIKRMSINFQKLPQDARANGRLGETHALNQLDASSSSANTAPTIVNTAASWSALLRPVPRRESQASKLTPEQQREVKIAGPNGNYVLSIVYNFLDVNVFNFLRNYRMLNFSPIENYFQIK